jgi:hypothetical protein
MHRGTIVGMKSPLFLALVGLVITAPAHAESAVDQQARPNSVCDDAQARCSEAVRPHSHPVIVIPPPRLMSPPGQPSNEPPDQKPIIEHPQEQH